MSSTFDSVGTPEDLRQIYSDPLELSLRKEIDRLDKHCRDFLALSPFMVIGSAGAEGHADVSPKGDQPGFTIVLDDKHILIPDRPGNNRLDTMQNIVENPEVATIFFVPGVKETLRIAGRASVVSDEEVIQRFAVNGKPPKAAVLIEIRQAYMHCAKAISRSKLWEDTYKVERNVLPRYAQMLSDHSSQCMEMDEIQDAIDVSETQRMW